MQLSEHITQRVETEPLPLARGPNLTVCKSTAIAAAVYAILGGAVTLAGWIFNISRLTDWVDIGIGMFANTALCAVLGGVALLAVVQGTGRWSAIVARSAGGLMALIGGLTLVEHMFNVSLGIDTLLVERSWGQQAAAAPMRMGLPASTSFLLLGAALVLITTGPRGRKLASLLAFIPVAIASLSLTGYLFGADQLFGVALWTGIALQTSTIIAALGVGTLAAVPEHGIVAALRRPDAGGETFRRLIIPVIAIPFVLGWLRILGQQAGLYDTAFGTALRTLAEVLLFLAMVWWTSNGIGRISQAAQDAQGRLGAIVESSDDAIISKSLDGVIQSWNAGAERVFGYTAAEAEGQPILMVIPHDRRQEEVEILSRLRRGERIEHFETVRRRKDGTLIDVSLTVSPVRDAAGTIIGASKIARDISELKRDQAAIQRSAEELRLLNSTGAVVSSTLDLESLLQSVTDIATQLSGAQFGAFFYNTTDDNGDSYLLFTLAGAPREAFEKFGQPRATPLFGPTFNGEGIIRLDDVLADPRYGQMAPHQGMPPGHLPVRSYLAVPVRTREGVVIGGLFFGHPEVGVFTEKAERLVSGVAAQAAIALDNARLYDDLKRAVAEREYLLDAERAARSEAERVNLMKDEFLATLSHELRTPLTAILGWAQLLSSGGLKEEDIQQGLDTIERNAHAQAQLIEDLLDMSRIVSGKVQLNVQSTDLASVIDQALESVRPSVESKQIVMRKIIDPNTGAVSGDPTRLQQVVWNLLTNAVKFTPKNGRIEVILQRVNSHAEIIVHDSGVGMEAEFLPYVFDRFRQADSSTTRSYSGLGLGLSIVKNLVQLHGGTVQADSPGEDQGSTFTVCLPLASVRGGSGRTHPTASVQSAPDVEMMRLTGTKVLVVDDEPDARALIGRVLTQSEAEVFLASDADAGLELIRSERPNVIVSDIGMPGKDGYEFIRELRRSSPTDGSKTPAIALTAFARSEDRTRALLAGFQMHVAKPIEPRELLAAIGSLISRDG